MFRRSFVTTLFLLAIALSVSAHPGRTDGRGGHRVRTSGWGYPVGSYHYHNGGPAPILSPRTIRIRHSPRNADLRIPAIESSIDADVLRRGTSTRGNSYRSLVVAAQKALIRLGYDCGSPDGRVGSRTVAALSAFQHGRNFDEAGTLTSETVRALAVELAALESYDDANSEVQPKSASIVSDTVPVPTPLVEGREAESHLLERNLDFRGETRGGIVASSIRGASDTNLVLNGIPAVVKGVSSEENESTVDTNDPFTAASPPSRPRRILSQPLPTYPEWAERGRVEALCRFKIVVTPSGRVERVVLMSTSGHRDLDRLAESSVRRWIYEPRLGDSEVRMAVVQFRLRR
jgi:TonB family protein